MGTKFDHLVNFPREDQEEITKQVIRFPNVANSGSTICTRDESESYLLFYQSLYQRPKSNLSCILVDVDFQNRLVQSI